MSREKQIEEMAKALCNGVCSLSECMPDKHCTSWKYAERAVDKGYRKSTVLAEEIFAEIEASAKVKYWRGGGLVVFEVNGEDFAELKKKYTEGAE